MKFSSKNFLPATAVAVLLCLGFAPSNFAATANVLVGSGGLFFTPAITNIATGDQVIWTWDGSNHSTTSGTNGAAGDDNGVPGGLWNSGVNNAGHTFTNTFATSGTYSYYCSVHFSFGMTGAVIVAVASLPPTITITNPVSGAVFAAPANVTIQATNSGTVTNVQFLAGSTILTNETTAPFSAVANNLPAGSYALSAIASDNLGAKATNAVNISVVTPVQINLNAPQQLSPTSFQFNYSANTGLSYVVQLSTNLASSNWTAIFTNTATSNPATFVDSNATVNPGFYRVGRLPNP
jgi:plastocyanin